MRPLKRGKLRTEEWELRIESLNTRGRAGFIALLFSWVRGLNISARSNSYQATIEFPLACGIQVWLVDG